MKTMLNLCMVVVSIVFYAATVWGFLETSDNNFFGVGAGVSTTGTADTYMGALAGTSNTTGSSNTFMGANAGSLNITGSSNTFMGTYAGLFNYNGSFNTFMGANAGYNNITGSGNTFIGDEAGYNNTAGTGNTFMGDLAGYSHTTGGGNTLIGVQAGYNNITGTGNTFMGAAAGYNNTGLYNTFTGSGAGYNNTTGTGNVFLGNGAGYSDTASNKLYIDNCYTLGACDQPLIKGDFAARTLQIDGSLTMVSVATPSDERYKKEIQPLESSLEKVMHLQGVSYEWKKNEVMGAGFKDGRQIGLIAQEVEKVLPELVMTDEKGYKALSYDKLAPVLIEAVKEQQKEIESLRATVNELKTQMIQLVRRSSKPSFDLLAQE